MGAGGTGLHRWLACALVAVAVVAGATARTRAAGDLRSITFFNIHNNETTTIPFKKDGQFISGALEKLDRKSVV